MNFFRVCLRASKHELSCYVDPRMLIVFARRSVCLSVYLCIVCLSVCLSVCLLVCLCIASLSVFVFICLFVWYMFVFY